MSAKQLIDTINGLGDAFAEFKTLNDRRLKAMADGNEALANELERQVSSLQERIEELESRASMPGRTGAKSAAASEHMRRFTNWIRKPHDSEAKNELSEFESRERKSISIGSAADGGFAVPEEISREIERLELKLSPVRQLVKVIQVGSNDFKHLVNVRGANSGWVGESGPRTETSTPQLRERQPTMGEIYAYPQTTEWALDDIAKLSGSSVPRHRRERYRCKRPVAANG